MILLIGNGPSADVPEVAAAMTKATRVLRMNNWQPGRYIGERCDIWGTSFNVDIVARRPTQEVWWTGWPYGCPGFDDYYKVVTCQQWNRYDRVASRALIDRAFSATSPKHPSTGIVLALMAAEIGEPISLAGFDHFSGPRHHYWTNDPAICDPFQYHDPESERKILEELGLLPIDGESTFIPWAASQSS